MGPQRRSRNLSLDHHACVVSWGRIRNVGGHGGLEVTVTRLLRRMEMRKMALQAEWHSEEHLISGDFDMRREYTMVGL